MRLNKLVFLMALLLVFSVSCVLSSEAASSGFAAKVNGVGIKNATLEAAITNFIENQKMLGGDVKEEKKDELRKDILEELISAELLYQESRKAGLGDLTEDIETQFKGIKEGFPSEDEFNKILKDRGITANDLKEDIRKGVYITKFLNNNVYSKITISEEDKRQEYEKNKDRLNVPEQIRASHILIRTKEGATELDKEEARAKIEDLRKRAVSGEDFAELAKGNSEDGSAPQGGDLGYFRRGDMVRPFEEAAFSLEKGEISDIVETQFGYHIVKLVDKQAPRSLDYNEVEEGIEKFLRDKQGRDKVNELVEELRKNAKIGRYIK